VGSINYCTIAPREIFRNALLIGAVSVIIAHNHPSGDPEPSPEDIAVTRRIAEAGRMLSIPLTDHVIIGSGDKFTSLAETGII
jgi:DNA repair protein RadC